MNKKTLIVTTALISAVSVLLLTAGIHFLTMSDTERLERIILRRYAGETSREELEEGALYGMMATLDDPYSLYYSGEEYRMFLEDMDAEYTGIGVELSLEQGGAEIVTVFAGSPAAEAGLLQGDILVRVGDMEVNADTYLSVVRVLRQESCEDGITVTVLHQNEEKTMTLYPRKIGLDTVLTEQYDDIAYIRIRSFDTPTDTEFAAALKEAEEGGARGIVLDLRDNPGGYLHSVTAVADRLLPACTIVYTEDKNGKRTSEYKSDKAHSELPISVLINENSASAAEVLAGTLKDNGRATLVGTTTFGKGSVQELYPLKNGGARVTVAHYFTPGGYVIDKNGVTPDIYVEAGETSEDLQLAKALEFMKNQ